MGWTGVIAERGKKRGGHVPRHGPFSENYQGRIEPLLATRKALVRLTDTTAKELAEAEKHLQVANALQEEYSALVQAINAVAELYQTALGFIKDIDSGRNKKRGFPQRGKPRTCQILLLYLITA